MLMQPPPQGQSISRPFLAGVLMLMLFFSLSTDWSSSKQSTRRSELRQLGFPNSPETSKFPSTHEKLIHELSLSNDKLERENWKMKQHILDLKRILRKHDVELNASQLAYPELDSAIDSQTTTAGDSSSRKNETSLTELKSDIEESSTADAKRTRHSSRSHLHRNRAGNDANDQEVNNQTEGQ